MQRTTRCLLWAESRHQVISRLFHRGVPKKERTEGRLLANRSAQEHAAIDRGPLVADVDAARPRADGS
jgi:hypothetical protein